MKVKDVMSDQVFTIESNQNLKEAACRMRDDNIGSLPITEEGRLIGIITDRDIVIRSVCEGADPQATLVKDAMTPAPTTCSLDESVEKAAQKMQYHQIRRIVVIDKENVPKGIMSLADLAGNPQTKELAEETLCEVCEPAASAR